MDGQPCRNFTKMASWSGASEHLVKPIGMSDQLKWNNKSDIGQLIKPNLTLFVPVIAISLYTIMDRVMLGMMSSMTEVGYYENLNKLTQIPVMAISFLGTVMLPRISNMISNGKKEESIKYIQKSLIVSGLLSTSMAFGLFAVSNEFVPIFYGSGFNKCKEVISILVLSSIFISWVNVIRTQYWILNKKDKIYIIFFRSNCKYGNQHFFNS